MRHGNKVYHYNIITTVTVECVVECVWVAG